MKWFLVVLMISATTVGDVLRSLGMRQHGEVRELKAGAIGRALSSVARNKYVIISTCAMAVSFFTFIRLLAVAPLSFAVPVSAAAMIPETILARTVLHENVGWNRWLGILLVAAGVWFISQ